MKKIIPIAGFHNKIPDKTVDAVHIYLLFGTTAL